MPPRRSSARNSPDDERLGGAPARADSSSSSATNPRRRSKSAESDGTDDTALTPVPEGDEVSKRKKRQTDDGDDEGEENLDEGDKEDDEDSSASSPRRSKRRRVQTSRAAERDGEDEADERPKRRGRFVLEISPPAKRRTRRASSAGTDGGDGDGDGDEPIQDTEPRRRSGRTSLDEHAQPGAVGKADGQDGSSPLTSPPVSINGKSSTDNSFKRAKVQSEADAPVDEVEVSAEEDDEEEARPAKPARKAPPVKRVVKKVPKKVNGATAKVIEKEKAAASAATKKRQNALTASTSKDWFEVVVRRDPYAVVTATLPSFKRGTTTPRSLSALSVVRSTFSSSSLSAFTSYRFPLPSAGKAPPIDGVVVRLEGKKKVRGPSGVESVSLDDNDGSGGEGKREHWVLVIKRDKAKWVVR
ncbi:hypothetical protein JCM10450v2_007283 [Rhodotorula kratochvilovae]